MPSFSALQRAENSSTRLIRHLTQFPFAFQCSSASRKFLNWKAEHWYEMGLCVSVLFSEPKIPQQVSRLFPTQSRTRFQCSSASRKFLNEGYGIYAQEESAKFQCSSASRKFLNLVLSSDSQRFLKFQCSSASRKFLNIGYRHYDDRVIIQFQCSSASRKFLNWNNSGRASQRELVSVLFSEPKIPQPKTKVLTPLISTSFSALQRAENSSTCTSAH